MTETFVPLDIIVLEVAIVSRVPAELIPNGKGLVAKQSAESTSARQDISAQAVRRLRIHVHRDITKVLKAVKTALLVMRNLHAQNRVLLNRTDRVTKGMHVQVDRVIQTRGQQQLIGMCFSERLPLQQQVDVRLVPLLSYQTTLRLLVPRVQSDITAYRKLETI